MGLLEDYWGDFQDHVDTIRVKVGHLPDSVSREVFRSLYDSGIIAWSLDDLRPAETPLEHSFALKAETPIHTRVRRLPPRHDDVVREEIDKMLSAGIITPSTSAWSFPVIIATKKDGKPRFCVDYRALNQVMKPDRWPLPKIEEILDDPEGANVFSTLDLFSGYWEDHMAEHCKEVTTFVCWYGTFKFEVMPFGLMNAPSTFQRMVDLIFRNYSFFRVYLDDVVVFSADLKEHVEHLGDIFSTIAKHGLRRKVSKCSFAHSKIKLLGHVIDVGRIAVGTDKIGVIKSAPIPGTTTEISSFLGLAGY